MKKAAELVKRYKSFLQLLLVEAALLMFVPQKGIDALIITKDNIIEMLSVIPPIFILLGLLDVWVDRETMIKYMGQGSGFKGGLLAFVLGSAAAGPLYAAFPFAAVMMKKGARLLNVFIFVGAWSTTKIPLLLFETTSLGLKYTLLRLCFNVVGIIVIAVLLEKSLSEEDKQQIYKNGEAVK